MASRKTGRTKTPPKPAAGKTAAKRKAAARPGAAAATSGSRAPIGTTKVQCPHGASSREFCRVPNDAKVGATVLCTPLGHELSVLSVNPFTLG